jgi:uncharacterized membrane protein
VTATLVVPAECRATVSPTTASEELEAVIRSRREEAFVTNKTHSRFTLPRVARLLALGALAVFLLALTGCAAGSERFVQEPAGFWMGLWHGLIVVITFVISLFTDNVNIYEVHNNGNWYDFGFMLGLFIAIGGSCKGHRRKRKPKRSEEEWEEIAAKVERKVRRGIDKWVEEREQSDDEWEEIGQKIEDKIKRELKDWAES